MFDKRRRKRAIDESINILETAKRLHAQWYVKLTTEPEFATEEVTVENIAGSAAWHEHWVDMYSHVIDTLQAEKDLIK